MKVFISWSGDTSRRVAEALQDWIPNVINEVSPFVSSTTIESGQTWQTAISAELETTDFGILCVTVSNQEAPWLNFEAGAIAKQIGVSRVVPIAIDLRPSDIKKPLGQFQGESFTEEGVMRLLTSMNGFAATPLEATRLKKAAQKWWPDLASTFDEIMRQPSTTSRPVLRTDRDMLDEVLDTVRSLARSVAFRPEIRDLDDNHPLLGEVAIFLKKAGYPSKVMVHGPRQMMIQSTKTLDSVLEHRVRRAATEYGFDVKFFDSARPAKNASEANS